MCFRNIETGEMVKTFTGHKDIITSCQISPDGQLLYSSSKDKTLKAWNLKTGKSWEGERAGNNSLDNF